MVPFQLKFIFSGWADSTHHLPVRNSEGKVRKLFSERSRIGNGRPLVGGHWFREPAKLPCADGTLFHVDPLPTKMLRRSGNMR